MAFRAFRPLINGLPGGYRCKSRTGSLVLLLLFFCFSLEIVRAQQSGFETVTAVTRSGEHRFQAELAETPAKREFGLMFRRSLPENSGMLFIFDDVRVIDMWMKNTYIPLDMVFIGPDGVVVSVAMDTEPFSEAIITSGAPALAVLEVKAGTARRIGLQAGDRIIHRAFKP